MSQSLSTTTFSEIPSSEWVASNSLAFAIRDRFPVTPGHTLIITRRVVPTWFEATPQERAAVLELVERVKAALDEELRPEGYNVGFNAGEAAGQTVMHLHVHVIPRRRGDMDDPRGGVRHVIPSKGNYRACHASPLSRGGTTDSFLKHVGPLFVGAREITILAAFVQDSGLRLLRDRLFDALSRGCRVRLLTGDYLNITQAEALQQLLDWMNEVDVTASESDADAKGGTLEARIVEVARLGDGITSFHPKSWRFEGAGLAAAFVGSSNISHAALSRTFRGYPGSEGTLRSARARGPGLDEVLAHQPRGCLARREWHAQGFPLVSP